MVGVESHLSCRITSIIQSSQKLRGWHFFFFFCVVLLHVMNGEGLHSSNITANWEFQQGLSFPFTLNGTMTEYCARGIFPLICSRRFSSAVFHRRYHVVQISPVNDLIAPTAKRFFLGAYKRLTTPRTSLHPTTSHQKPSHKRTITMAAPILNVESAKRLAAHRAVDEHFPAHARHVGIGSGSTVVYVVERIAQLSREITDGILFVPTGYQSRELILRAGLKLGSIELHTDLEVAFDGADEVDPYLNCIKGGGACLFQEKLVAISAKKFVVVAGMP